MVKKDFAIHIREKQGHVNYLVAIVSSVFVGSFNTKIEWFEKMSYNTKWFLVKTISTYSLTPVSESYEDVYAE